MELVALVALVVPAVRVARRQVWGGPAGAG